MFSDVQTATTVDKGTKDSVRADDNNDVAMENVPSNDDNDDDRVPVDNVRT